MTNSPLDRFVAGVETRRRSLSCHRHYQRLSNMIMGLSRRPWDEELLEPKEIPQALLPRIVSIARRSRSDEQMRRAWKADICTPAFAIAPAGPPSSIG